MQKAARELAKLAGWRRVPGPHIWPIVGNPAALRAPGDLIGFGEGYWHRYGDIFRVSLFNRSIVVLAHPNAIKYVLCTARENYIRGSVYASTRRLIGDSVLTLEGEAGRARRELQQTAFHRGSVEKLVTQMVASGARHCDALAGRAREGVVAIDAHREMARLTLEVFVRALFGQALQGDFGALTDVMEVVSDGANRFMLPPWVPTPRNWRWQQAIASLDAHLYGLIELARKQGSDDSLLSMLIAARDAQGAPLEDRAVRDEVITLFIAGHETMALTLTWLFALVGRHRDVLPRMQREVDHVVGRRDPRFSDFAELQYVRQVIDETLRLRPPVPMVARDVVDHDAIHGYEVYAGEIAIPFIWATHRHPDFWADPLQFDPDRFEGQRATRHSSWSYVPFSAGPRACLGDMFSLVQTVLLLAQLLQRFELQIEDCADVKPVMMLSASPRPSRPFRIELRPRRSG